MTDEAPRPDHPDGDRSENGAAASADAGRTDAPPAGAAADDARYEASGPDGPATDAAASDPAGVGRDPEGDVTIAAGAVVTRVCRRCSTQAATSGAFCPHCGAAYERRRRGPRSWSRRTRLATAVLVVALLLGAGGAVVALEHAADQRAEDRERAAQERRDREAAAARAAEEEADAQEAGDRLARSLRRSTVRDLRRSITKDARERVSEGVLDGPILSTSCENLDGNEEALDEDAGTYDCMAVTEKLSGGRSRGYRFSARVDYEEHSYTWRLGD